MSKTKKLHNKGQRKIVVGGKDFLPGKTVAFPIEIAERLQALYPLEVQDLESAVEHFKDEPGDSTPAADETGDSKEDADEKKADGDNNVPTKEELKALKKEAKKAGFDNVEDYLEFKRLEQEEADAKAKETGDSKEDDAPAA